ncbi:MAG: hypothetical protein AAF748_05780 [Pseudomonadota bacterium]
MAYLRLDIPWAVVLIAALALAVAVWTALFVRNAPPAPTPPEIDPTSEPTPRAVDSDGFGHALVGWMASVLLIVAMLAVHDFAGTVVSVPEDAASDDSAASVAAAASGDVVENATSFNALWIAGAALAVMVAALVYLWATAYRAVPTRNRR